MLPHGVPVDGEAATIEWLAHADRDYAALTTQSVVIINLRPLFASCPSNPGLSYAWKI